LWAVARALQFLEGGVVQCMGALLSAKAGDIMEDGRYLGYASALQAVRPHRADGGAVPHGGEPWDPGGWYVGTDALLAASVKAFRLRLLRLRVLHGPHAHQLVAGRAVRPALWQASPGAVPSAELRVVYPFGGVVALEQHWQAHMLATFPQAVAMMGMAGLGQAPSPQLVAMARQAARGLCVRTVWTLSSTWDDILARAPHGLPHHDGIAGVWNRLRTLAHLPLEARCVAWRVLHGVFYCGAFHMRVNTGCTLQRACCALQGCEGVLQGLTHAFLACPGMALAVDWFCQVWHAVGGASPPKVAAVFLADDVGVWRPPAHLAVMWSSLRVMFLYCASRCMRGVPSFSSPLACARAVVGCFVRSVRALIAQDWGKVVSGFSRAGVRPLSCAAFELRWCHGGVLAAVSGPLEECGLGNMSILLSCSQPVVLPL
jgi:hypothetical protein